MNPFLNFSILLQNIIGPATGYGGRYFLASELMAGFEKQENWYDVIKRHRFVNPRHVHAKWRYFVFVSFYGVAVTHNGREQWVVIMFFLYFDIQIVQWTAVLCDSKLSGDQIGIGTMQNAKSCKCLVQYTTSYSRVLTSYGDEVTT